MEEAKIFQKTYAESFKSWASIIARLQNIWQKDLAHMQDLADLADMQFIWKNYKGVRFLLSAICIYRKYTWIVPLVGKKGKTIEKVFKSIMILNRKADRLWVDEIS